MIKHRFIDTILQLDQAQWNQLCPPGYPFARYQFLADLELSGATTAASGWQPQHLLIEQEGTLVAALPTYIKTHSYGEYVFDWAWADAYHRYGQPYYPKLVSAIPFTPCQGPRLLGELPAGVDMAQVADWLKAHCRARQLSGWHCLFPQPEEAQAWSQGDNFARLGCQFHWFNRGYGSFDDFVAAMNSRKRKNILKERRQLTAAGIYFDWLEGDKITAGDLDGFYQFYRATYLKRSGHQGYLNRDFFLRLGQNLADHLLLIRAFSRDAPGEPIAGALLFHDQQTLYGRYWGCRAEFQFLHFETCYYQGIDFAIARGLKRFDGGAQGEHKIARGFEPVFTHSRHWLADERFHQAIAQAMHQEALQVQAYGREAAELLPFKSSAD